MLENYFTSEPKKALSTGMYNSIEVKETFDPWLEVSVAWFPSLKLNKVKQIRGSCSLCLSKGVMLKIAAKAITPIQIE